MERILIGWDGVGWDGMGWDGMGRWVNGQHLRLLPQEQLTALIGAQWVRAGLTKKADGTFVEVSVQSRMEK